MEIKKRLYVSSRKEWREWLEKNHDKETEVWLISYKPHTGRPRVRYEDAVEEALCFGWIDSTAKRIDEDSSAQKFTPRKPKSNWSESNLKRVQKLLQQGLMTEAGKRMLPPPGTKPVAAPKYTSVPPYIKKAIRANATAWKNFQALAPSYQREYIAWIDTAKREETRQRRMGEAMERLARNEKLGMK